jgi:predicted SPOUT superfamily RNA methylase MTH1
MEVPMMKRALTLLAAVLLPLSAAARDYQVTGPVLEVTPNAIVVEKDKEKWEIARDKNTKVSGDLKKGARVTVRYTMTAESIEVRDAAKKGDEKKAKK